MSSSAARFFPGVFAKRNGNGAHGQSYAASSDSSECRENSAAVEVEVSDERLILRLQEKDVSALGLLYRRYARLVYSLSSRIIRDPAEAEDLVHEVFLSLYKKCGSFDATRGSARSWLVQLTYHKCFDWRDYLKARHGFQQGNGGGEFSPSEGIEETSPPEPLNLIDMRSVLSKLTREQRAAFKLRAAGYTFPEIAEKLGCSEGNAKNHLYRGIRHMREIVFEGSTRRLTAVAHDVTGLVPKSAVP
jgi:RNA polymerase sigma-70 factor, ECF subfamily